MTITSTVPSLELIVLLTRYWSTVRVIAMEVIDSLPPCLHPYYWSDGGYVICSTGSCI